MAYIQKRALKDGAIAYIVKWKTPDGKHRTRGGFRTRKAAAAYAADVEHSLHRGSEFDSQSGNTTFRVAAQAWLASRHDLKPTTLAEHRCALAPYQRRRGDGKTLGIDAVLGGYPLNAIKRADIQGWVACLVAAGKKPPTVRYQYSLVRMVLAQAVVDGRLPNNPADYVKLPTEHSVSGAPGTVDNPAQFLTAQQVTALVAATPWPYNVYIHVAAWAGLRAAELCGLQVGDVELAQDRPGLLRVERTARPLDGAVAYLAPKTKGSRRRVPLTAETTALLRGYLAEHPYGPTGASASPTAPLFPDMRLDPPSRNAAPALAAQAVEEAEARLALDWAKPLRHGPFYQLVYRPAVLRAGLPPALKFHSLRHTYASLCVAAGIPPLALSRFMGHTSVTTTLNIYAKARELH